MANLINSNKTNVMFVNTRILDNSIPTTLLYVYTQVWPSGKPLWIVWPLLPSGLMLASPSLEDELRNYKSRLKNKTSISNNNRVTCSLYCTCNRKCPKAAIDETCMRLWSRSWTKTTIKIHTRQDEFHSLVNIYCFQFSLYKFKYFISSIIFSWLRAIVYYYLFHIACNNFSLIKTQYT